MESENHENFPAIVKEYCEVKKEKKKKELEEEDKNKKKKKIVKDYNRPRGGMMIVGRDSNGKLIRIAKSYSEAKKEQEEEKMKKKKKKEEEGECDSEPEEPWEPRWSDENLALHLWRCMCRRKGVKVHEYVPRTDYHTMSGAEVKLDMLWRKVYKAEAEAEATTTTS
ncbi:hypothetical protein Tco_1126803 [Tanacetum coccineum]